MWYSANKQTNKQNYSLIVTCRPAISSLSLNETQKEGEEEACASAFNKSSLVVPCATLEARGRDSVAKQAPAVSTKKSQILRGDDVNGKQIMAKEDPTRGQLKLKTAPKSGNSAMMVLKHKNTIPSQKEHCLSASERPSRELQSALQRTSPVQSGKDQGDSCGTHIRTNRERRQTVGHNVVGFPTAVAPVDGTRKGQVQNSITNTVKAQNTLSSRYKFIHSVHKSNRTTCSTKTSDLSSLSLMSPMLITASVNLLILTGR